VLAQDFADFEYDIVDNCSTDGTCDIAQSYARQDRRIRVKKNTEFVSAIENHNRGFRLVPAHSKYCKVVSADDWIDPTCLSRMVEFAQGHRAVGIVGSYQRSGDIVKWRGVPNSASLLSGRDAARLGLLHGIHVLGTPTSVLYRADLLRMRKAFFPHKWSHADTSACYEIFRYADFGFLHEVLSHERIHPGQWSAEMDSLNAGSVSYIDVLLQYGPVFLTGEEFQLRKSEVFNQYYRSLGGDLLKLRGLEYWRFHRTRLHEMGCELDWTRVAKESLAEALSEARHPLTAMRKVAAVLQGRKTETSSHKREQILTDRRSSTTIADRT
jgi:glycosyltransferase involved in cell wall biosynthesis